MLPVDKFCSSESSRDFLGVLVNVIWLLSVLVDITGWQIFPPLCGLLNDNVWQNGDVRDDED